MREIVIEYLYHTLSDEDFQNLIHESLTEYKWNECWRILKQIAPKRVDVIDIKDDGGDFTVFKNKRIRRDKIRKIWT